MLENLEKALVEACQQGVQGEIENREMYQRLLNLTKDYPDVQQVFLNLQRASQENHPQLTGKKISRYRGWEILKQMSFRTLSFRKS
jgi:hypothetical protein